MSYVAGILNKPPFPASPQQSIINEKNPKQPCYYERGNYYRSIEWKRHQNWHEKESSLRAQLIEKWHKDPRIEGVSTLGGYNGQHWLGWVDFDVDDFSSLDEMSNELATWLEKNPTLKNAPQFRTPSGGYRVLVAFSSEPIDWGANNGFALEPNQTNRCGELLTKNGGHTLLPPSKGENGNYYEWVVFDGSYPPIVDSPESIGLYKVATAKKTYTAPNHNQKTNNSNYTDYPEVNKTELALECLRFLDPDCHHGEWLKIGAALYSVDPNLENEFDRWSSGGNKYKDSKEISTIWRSFSKGTKANIGTLVNMAKSNGFDASGWYSDWHKRNGSYRPQSGTTTTKQKMKMDKRAAIAEARKILTAGHDELTQTILLDDVREQAKINNSVWKFDIIKPLKRSLIQQRIALEITAYVNEGDIYKKVLLKQKICSNYSLSSPDFELLAAFNEKQQTTPQKSVFSFDEFFSLETEAENWLIPGLLPKGEMLLLAALPKVGKSLLATEVAYAVLCGGPVLGEKAKQGKVLYISSDESPSSLKRRFYARGFDLLPERNNLRVMTHLDLTNLGVLEEQLDEFRPDLVVVDSLTSITFDLGISENDSEFARYVYRFKDLLKRYNSASILIHHENKSKEQKGIGKVAGSARITAAVWGIAQLSGSSHPDQAEKVTRWLDLKPREGEAVKYILELNPRDSWSVDGIYNFIGEFDDPSGKNRTLAERVLELLKTFSPKGLEYFEINEHLQIGRSLYTVLDRLTERKLITKRRSSADKRRWIYAVPQTEDQPINKDPVEKFYQQAGQKNSQQPVEKNIPPLPLTVNLQGVDNVPESTVNTTISSSQQLVNKKSTVSQQPAEKNEVLNESNQDRTMNAEVSQQLSHSKGGGGIVENVDENIEPDDYCEQSHIIENDKDHNDKLKRVMVNPAYARDGLLFNCRIDGDSIYGFEKGCDLEKKVPMNAVWEEIQS
jgi:KaiC/GvpD/RAD55 family RecA-like ATPase